MKEVRKCILLYGSNNKTDRYNPFINIYSVIAKQCVY